MSKFIWLVIIACTNNLFLLATTYPSKLAKIQSAFSEGQAIINATISKAERYCGAKVLILFYYFFIIKSNNPIKTNKNIIIRPIWRLIITSQLASLFVCLPCNYISDKVCLLCSVYLHQ